MSRIKTFIISICLLFIPTAVYPDTLDCPCKVVKISDGDTIHILDQSRHRYKIRLAGIDAPEKDQDYGNKSTQNLAKLIAGQHIKVEYNKRDRYGRVLGKIFKDGQDINLAQIIEGFAWHYKKYKREQSKVDQVLYSSAETEARSRHIGLWAYPAAIPPWEFRKRK